MYCNAYCTEVNVTYDRPRIHFSPWCVIARGNVHTHTRNAILAVSWRQILTDDMYRARKRHQFEDPCCLFAAKSDDRIARVATFVAHCAKIHHVSTMRRSGSLCDLRPTPSEDISNPIAPERISNIFSLFFLQENGKNYFQWIKFLL